MELSMKLLGNKFTFGKSVTVSIGDQEASENNPNTATRITLSLFDQNPTPKTPDSVQTPQQELDDDYDDDRQHAPPGPSSSSSSSNKQDDAGEDEKMKKIAMFRDEVDDPNCYLGLMSTSSRHADVVVLNPQPLQSVSPSSSSPSSDGRKKRKKSTSEYTKRAKHENYLQVPTTDLSPKLLERIGETVVGPVFLYRKKLTDTDIRRNQNRLLVTQQKKLVDEFLTEQEQEAYAVDDHEKPRPRIDAFAVDEKGGEYHLHLSKWQGKPVFIHKWGDLVADNLAKTDDWVDLWGFRRHDNVFRLAVIFSS